MLALSQGLNGYTARTAYIYRTEGGSGGKNDIPIELKKSCNASRPMFLSWRTTFYTS